MHQDWIDDMYRFGNGAFVTITSDDGEYTDFHLTPEQVKVVFEALAKHD